MLEDEPVTWIWEYVADDSTFFSTLIFFEFYIKMHRELQ